MAQRPPVDHEGAIWAAKPANVRQQFQGKAPARPTGDENEMWAAKPAHVRDQYRGKM
jgi:hypothetical protein